MIENKISDKQLEANRLNALKSTGPKTLEGKEASSKNALKFGFTAKKFVIPDEEKAEFEDYHNKMVDTLKPHSILTEEMALNISLAFWKSRRYANLETLIIVLGQSSEVQRLSECFTERSSIERAEKIKIKNEPIYKDIDVVPPPDSFNIKSLAKISSMQNQECNRALRLLKNYLNVKSLENKEVLKDKESNYPLSIKN